MKLILDSETLNINCKMTEVQEVFSEQPLSNGVLEDIKNGDFCNGNSKIIEEETNGIEKIGNGGTGEIVEEKVKIVDELQTKYIETDDISEIISKESNDQIEPEKDICISRPIDEVSNTNIEEIQSANVEEPTKSSSVTLKDTSELQENVDRHAIEGNTEAKAVVKENAVIKDMLLTEVEPNSDKVDSEINLKQTENQVEVTNQEIQCKEPIKIDETIEKESKPIPKRTEPIKVDKFTENESNLLQINENIANESDADEITKNIDTVTTPSVDVLSCDKSVISSDDVTVTKPAASVDRPKEEFGILLKDEIDKLPKTEVENPPKDDVDVCLKDEVDILPKNDGINHSKKNSSTSVQVDETPMETDSKESLDSTLIINSLDDVTETAAPEVNEARISHDTASKKIDDIIEIDCTEKEHVIDIDSSDKETTAKGDSEADTVFNCEDSSDGCTVVETKEAAATNDMDVVTPLENSPYDSNNSNADALTDASKSAASSSKTKTICGLSNTLDIISDDEDETPPQATTEPDKANVKMKPIVENKCINLDDDDDIMVIDEGTSNDDINKQTETKEVEEKPAENVSESVKSNDVSDSPVVDEDKEAASKLEEILSQDETKETKTVAPVTSDTEIEKPDINEKTVEKSEDKPATVPKPLVPSNFLKTFKINVAEMTREELEEFCLIKIVEGIVEKSNLSEIKAKLKTMAQSVEEWRKKTMMLTKQNRDLQIVLKTVQEEQKKRPELPITPLKITRSVGMQVFMTEASEKGGNGGKRGRPSATTGPKQKPVSVNQRVATKPMNNTIIPVPRLVPAAVSSPTKPRTPSQVQSSAISSNTGKASPAATVKTLPAKAAEKRPFSSGSTAFTVDLTDDEPPAKQMPPRQAPVRLVQQQQLMAPRAQVNNVNSPRKVYIPINSQNQNQMRPAHAIMVKSVSPLGPRPRPPMIRLPNNSPNTVRPMRATSFRHPAPLPDIVKQQQPPNWKALPPSPDLKISKVENGIVISWKIEGYQEDSYEEIASYQLYAYQETSAPPSTLFWKKIGDVKALPLPMACTLTQFMAGYKYYFAVRAVDIRSRIGPFSLPGSILLLNK